MAVYALFGVGVLAAKEWGSEFGFRSGSSPPTIAKCDDPGQVLLLKFVVGVIAHDFILFGSRSRSITVHETFLQRPQKLL